MSYIINKYRNMSIEEKLNELKKYWEANNIPNISKINAIFLRDLIKIWKFKNILEIGTANWYSTINFALELKKTWWRITTIEFSSRTYNIALNNFQDFNVFKTIKAINWNALDIIPNLKENYDFVFIDWMKKRTKDFLELIWKKVKKDWIIIIDDVIKFKEKMAWLWGYLEKNNIKYNIIPIDLDDWILMIIK